MKWRTTNPAKSNTEVRKLAQWAPTLNGHQLNAHHLFQVAVIFGLQNRKLKLSRSKDGQNLLSEDTEPLTLHAQTVFAHVQ